MRFAALIIAVALIPIAGAAGYVVGGVGAGPHAGLEPYDVSEAALDTGDVMRCEVLTNAPENGDGATPKVGDRLVYDCEVVPGG